MGQLVKYLMITSVYDREACMALVDKSPAAVTVHDKAAWLALFARYNIVEDPVGSAPHLSGAEDDRKPAGPLDRFYETFIAPNDIRFHVDRDIVVGLHVVRDLTLEINMAPSVTVRTPMHLLYELREEEGELKIFRLAAHWEMLPAMKQQIASGVSSVRPALGSGWRMLRHLGVVGMFGFMRALSSVGVDGKTRVEQFVNYFNRREEYALRALFADPEAGIEFPRGGRQLSIAELIGEGGELVVQKLISAGNVTSASVCYQTTSECREGVAFFEFERQNLRIISLSLYWEE